MSETVTITSLRQLDALVAERVMGLQVRRDGNTYYCPKDNGGYFVPRFSEDMGAVPASNPAGPSGMQSCGQQIVEYLAKNGLTIELNHKFQATEVNVWRNTKRLEEQILDESAPIAICLAALRRVGVEVELMERTLL